MLTVSWNREIISAVMNNIEVTKSLKQIAANISAELDSAELDSAVTAYLLAKAHAEAVRERVDRIKSEILEDIPLYVSQEKIHREPGARITHPKDDWQADEGPFNSYLCEVDERLKADGIKPATMERDKCPALVSEHILCKAEGLLCEIAGKPFGLTRNMLLCSGIEAIRQFTDLVCSYVLSKKN
jgi:hypothetical protein